MRDGGFRDGGIKEGEIGDGHCRGRVLRDISLFKPNLINMNVHSATCSCPVELYKLWYILADFLPNWNFRGGFSTVLYDKTGTGTYFNY